MNPIARWIALTATLFASRTAFAQLRSLHQFSADHWTERDGLPNGAVLSVAEDRAGYLWVGTACCLLRFDGDAFTRFEDSRPGAKPFSFGRALRIAPNGVIWGATVGGLVRVIDDDLELFDDLPHPFLYALTPTHEGTLWVGTGGHGLWHFDGNKFALHPAYETDERLPTQINDLVLDEDNDLWAATEGGVLRLQNADVHLFTTADGLPGLGANVLLDATDGLWVGTRQGLAYRPPKSDRFEVESRLTGQDVTALLEDREGVLWIGTRTGLTRRSRDGTKIERETLPGVFALTSDHHGNIWVGHGDGLTRYHPGPFVTYGRPEGLPSENILNLQAHAGGGMWLLDNRGALSLFRDGTAIEVEPPGTYGTDGMLGMLETRDGTLWIGGPALHRRHDGASEVFRVDFPVSVMIEDDDGIILSQTDSVGASRLFRLDSAGLHPLYAETPLVHVQRLYIDSRHRLWVSTGGSGLVRFDDQQVRRFGIADGLPHNIVYGITEDSETGAIWVGTRTGLARLRDDQVFGYNAIPGAPTRSPVHLHIDDARSLWVTADDGVHRLSLHQLDAIAEGHGRRLVEQTFSTHDGLRSVEISWRCSAQSVDASGNLYYATTRGISIVDPIDTEVASVAPHVDLTAVRVGGRKVDDRVERFEVERGHRLEFDFTTAHLEGGHRPSFRYRLLPYERVWNEDVSTRQASYTNLPAGKYTFEVAARTHGGDYGDPTAVGVQVLPRWFETRPAKISLALLIFLGVFGVYRIRTYRLRQRERVLKKRVSERTQDLEREVAERRAAEQRVQELADDLERRVRERTAELELANRAIAQSEQRYELAVRGARDGIWDWDIRRNILYLSPRFKEILGYEDHQIRADLESWYAHTHPEDLPSLELALDIQANVECPLLLEYRMLHADGSIVWVVLQGTVVFEDGVPVRAAGSLSDITYRKLVETELRRRATHDALTGLPNRSLLNDRLDQAIVRSRRGKGLEVAVLLLDIDHFKTINDGLGHRVGDQLLVKIADRLQGLVRDVDSVARFGGDEFVVVMPDLRDREVAVATAVEILEVLRSPVALQDQTIVVTPSIGITFLRDSATSSEDLLREADTAMYRAKFKGRSRYELFDDSMQAQAVDRLNIEAGLRQALAHGELELHYQPLIALESYEVVGAEALIRWAHPQRGLLLPAQFLAIAEASGLIVPISEWVLQEACRSAAQWRGRLPHPVRISINVPPQFLVSPDFASTIRHALKQHDLPATALGIEIVESSVIEMRAAVTENLAELRELGVTVAIDDFGTGYSALSYLHQLRVDYLKIDRAFIRGVGEDANSTAICQTILDMARAVRIESVAEGVETQGQVDFLAREGCTMIQGYFLSRPLTADDFVRFVLAERPRPARTGEVRKSARAPSTRP